MSEQDVRARALENAKADTDLVVKAAIQVAADNGIHAGSNPSGFAAVVTALSLHYAERLRRAFPDR
jgi:hypothetical protein